MRESEVESIVVEWAKTKGIRSIKIASPNDRGKPDRMFMRKGKIAFIEFKATGKDPTALQEKWIADLNADGFRASWYDDPTDAIYFLKSVLC